MTPIQVLCTHVHPHTDDDGKVIRQEVSFFDPKTQTNMVINLTDPTQFGSFERDHQYAFSVADITKAGG